MICLRSVVECVGLNEVHKRRAAIADAISHLNKWNANTTSAHPPLSEGLRFHLQEGRGLPSRKQLAVTIGEVSNEASGHVYCPVNKRKGGMGDSRSIYVIFVGSIVSAPKFQRS